MILDDLVGFKSELFFDGAVQLRWVEEKVDKAADAAEHFVFHGPEYHGVHQDDADGISSAYKLKDTATLLMEFIEPLVSDMISNTNPFSLVVAGYGSGKSHFALTLAKLLMAPNDLLAYKILYSIKKADQEIGDKVQEILEKLKKPSLIVALDGMSNFHLGSELSRAVLRQLKANNLDLGPILELSPRFGYAQNFVDRNFDIRRIDFEKHLHGRDKNSICNALQENDDDIYQLVDDIYYKANGTRIPVEGRESAQDLINTVCENYCGENGHFSSLVILFDEFGRYLEYAAEKPWLAGDSALQQIFQGVQDNSERARFVGFIQYELKAYLNRFSQKEMQQLQRYITRFDSAQKLFLSTNLETLFAHLIEKKDPEKLNALIDSEGYKRMSREVHTLMGQNIPGINKYNVWKDNNQFHQVIVKGCWPLHPITTWFLTRQQDIVQSRSALTFIKDVLSVSSQKKIDPDAVRLYSISPAELVLRSMLEEIKAAERTQGGVIAETLCTVLEMNKARLSEPQKLVLAGIMILDKLRVATRDKGQIDRFLCMCTALISDELEVALHYLSNGIGVVEWNKDLCQYELVADAATRGQFQQALKKKLSEIDRQLVGELFTARARAFGDIGDIETDFALSKEIYSRDWCFSAIFVQGVNYLETISRSFQEWRSSDQHDDAKGRVIYLYLGPSEHPDFYLKNSKEHLNQLLLKNNIQAAPIWTVVIHDKEGAIADNLVRFHILEDKFSPNETLKFSRFLPEEKERTQRSLREEVQRAVQQRISLVAGIETITEGRLKQTAQAIFEGIYPKAFPFPFDGFQAKTGAGPKECLQLTRALIGRQVSGDWIATQATQIQNRVTRLFVMSWKVLGNDGRLSLKPGLKDLADLLEFVETLLKKPGATLFDAYNALVEPPFGFNSSSAGLILGLVLARETPTRAFTYQGESIGVQDWLQRAFPKGAKIAIDKSCLKLTQIAFLSDDSLQRWKKIIADIEFEENLRKKIALFEYAIQMKKSEQIPITLLDRFVHVTEKVDHAYDLLSTHDNNVDELENFLLKAVERDKINNIIRSGSDLKKILDAMDKQPVLWGEDDLSKVKELVAEARRSLQNRIASWVEDETCNGFGQLDVFRRSMDWAIVGLNLLDMPSDAALVDNHKHLMISQIEKRLKYETSITSAQDLVRQPLPSKTFAAWKMKEEIKTCEASITNLQIAKAAIDSADIKKLIEQVKERINQAKSCLKEQKATLSNICSSKIFNIQNVVEVKNKIAEQVPLFRGTPDEEYLNDMIKQLDILHSDMKAWGSAIMSPEDTDRVLKEKISERCAELETLISEDMEQTWDFESVYLDYCEFLVEERRQQSTKWFNTVKPDVARNLDSWTLQECQKQLEAISEFPKFISNQHLMSIKEIQKLIVEQLNYLKELDRERVALQWIDNIKIQMIAINTLSLGDCERLLRALEQLPEVISDKEIHHVIALRKMLTERQDSIDIKSMLDRIHNLRHDLKIEFLGEMSAVCRLFGRDCGK